MVNGFTHSVLQCDGHSGLMKLQDQAGKDLSLPVQISPPYSRQSPGTVASFHKTLCGQVRAIQLGLAAHLGIHADSIAARLMPWIIQHAVFTINRYLIPQDGKTSHEQVFNKVLWFILGKAFWLMFKPPLPPKSFVESPGSEALLDHCGCGNVSSLECTSWLTRVRFSKPEQSLVWSKSSNSMLSSSTRSLFPIMNQNLTIKNLKKIVLLFKNCSGHSSCNKNQRYRIKTSSLQISVSNSLLSTLAHHSRLRQPRERSSNHHHCQQHISITTISHSLSPRSSDTSRTSSSASAIRS